MKDARQQRDFRRNFIFSTILHVGMIGSVLLLAAFAPKNPERPVWIELGSGGEPGGGGGGDDKEAGGAPAPGPDAEPAPPPPPAAAAQPEVKEPVAPKHEPEPKPEPVKPPETKKPDIKRAELPTDLPKKVERKVIEKPKPEPKVVAQPKKAEPGKIERSTKLVTRPKQGATTSTTQGVVGGIKGGTGRTVGSSGRNFNAGAFRSKVLGMVGGGVGTGTGTGRGKSGPGFGTGIGRGIGPGTGTGGLPSEFGWYYAMIKMAMDEAWQQPSQLPGRLTCVVTIRIQRDGTISHAWFGRRSGDDVMDESALSAAKNVRRIAPPPQGLCNGQYVDVPVEFELKPQRSG
jgi:protein TonB